jgi:hypothetical protein
MVEANNPVPTKDAAQHALDDLRNALKGNGSVTEANLAQIKQDLNTMIDFKNIDAEQWWQILENARITNAENHDIMEKLRMGNDVNKRLHSENGTVPPTNLFLEILKVFQALLTSRATHRSDGADAALTDTSGEIVQTQAIMDRSIILYLNTEMKGRSAITEEQRKTMLNGMEERGYSAEKSNNMAKLLRETLADGSNDCHTRLQNMLQACREVDDYFKDSVKLSDGAGIAVCGNCISPNAEQLAREEVAPTCPTSRRSPASDRA